MPKLKNRKGVVKRFKLSKKGKIKYRPSGKSHLLTGKKRTRIRRLKRVKTVQGKRDEKYFKRMLPYG